MWHGGHEILMFYHNGRCRLPQKLLHKSERFAGNMWLVAKLHELASRAIKHPFRHGERATRSMFLELTVIARFRLVLSTRNNPDGLSIQRMPAIPDLQFSRAVGVVLWPCIILSEITRGSATG